DLVGAVSRPREPVARPAARCRRPDRLRPQAAPLPRRRQRVRGDLHRHDGEEGFVYQAIAPIPHLDGNYPVLGSWVIDGEPAGIGIRESTDLVTSNTSRFVPHL